MSETAKKPYRAISDENYERFKRKFKEKVIDEIIKIENLIPDAFTDASMNPAGDRLVLTRMDGTTEEIPIDGGAGNIEVGDVTGATVTAKHGRALITWTDPGNVVIEGATLARWAGTLVVRKAGSAPNSKSDGDVVVDSTTRNAYASTAYVDSGLTDGTIYYYRFFPHTTGLAYTPGTTLSATPDRETVEIPTAAGQLYYTGSYQEQAFENYDNTKMTRTGTIGGTDAGEYIATYTLLDDYKWSDGTITAKDVKWRIKPQLIANVPSQSGTLTYNGTEQTVTWLNFDSTKMDIEGSETETDAGEYSVTIAPKSNYAWSNESQAARTVTWRIEQKIVTIPTVSDRAKTYTTLEQSPTISAYDTAAVNQTGTAAATNAGDYTITFVLKDKTNTMWTDETTEDKEFAWSIAKASIADVPSQNGTLTYNGSSREPSWANYDPTMLTIGGTTSGTNAGDYDATFTPTANFQWPGGGTEAKNVTWTIAKAAGTITLSKNSVSLDTTTLSDTVTVSYAGDGTLSVSSSDTSIATATRSGSTVTITAVATGSATVTVSATAGANYEAGTATVSVTCALALEKALADCTPAEIKQIVDAGTAASLWHIGDKTAAITLSGKVSNGLTLSNYTCHAVLIGLDHNKENETGGKSSAHFILGKDTSNNDIAFCDFTATNYANKTSGTWFNHSNANSNSGGWKSSNIRTNIMPKFIAALPAAWQSVLGTVTKYTDNTGGGSDNSSYVTSTSDKMFLLAEFEAFGTRYYANSEEKNKQTQYAYYANGNSRVRYNHQTTSSAVYWWLRSVSSSHSNFFCYVNTGGSYYYYYAYITLGVAPGFAIVKS